MTDQNSVPVDGVRVDFAVTGANATSGFAFTTAQGGAEFCYTGPNTGDDTIKASVGNLSDATAADAWDRHVHAQGAGARVGPNGSRAERLPSPAAGEPCP